MKLEDLIDKLETAEYEKFMADVMEYKSALGRELAQKSFLEYVKLLWHGFIHG